MEKLKKDKYATLKKKIFWTALYFVSFMIGRNVPIPHLYGTFSDVNVMNTQLLNAANIATGGNFFSPSVFSLGLGPWMGAAILWRFLFIGKIAGKRKVSEKITNYARVALMVVLAVFQAISLMSNYQIKPLALGPFSERMNAQILVLLVMVAGSLLVVWLANRNEEKGLGGMTMFILYQIISTVISNLSSLLNGSLDAEHRMMLTVIGITCILVLILTIVAGNAELRLHVNKIGIDSGYTGRSYLPIKVNPAGASPIMYGLTLLTIPQYIIHALILVFPGITTGADEFFSYLTLTNPVGFHIYLVLLFGLTIFFGLFTVGPKDIAEQMKNTGDYFDFIPPGTRTRQYLRKRVVVLSMISGVFLVVFTGLPLYFMEIDQNISFLFMLPGTVMMFVSLLLVVREEVADIMIGTKYSPIFFK